MAWTTPLYSFVILYIDCNMLIVHSVLDHSIILYNSGKAIVPFIFGYILRIQIGYWIWSCFVFSVQITTIVTIQNTMYNNLSNKMSMLLDMYIVHVCYGLALFGLWIEYCFRVWSNWIPGQFFIRKLCNHQIFQKHIVTNVMNGFQLLECETFCNFMLVILSSTWHTLMIWMRIL